MLVCVSGDGRVWRLLSSLRDQSAQPDSYEVIVVENGSDTLHDVADDTAPNIAYFRLSAANVATARQAGLAAARGRYLLMTDADCVVTRTWIEEMTAALRRGHWTGVGGSIEKYRPESVTQRFGITIVDGQRKLSYLRLILHLPYVVSANAGFVTAAVREVGGFDEAFRSGSDVDLCYRLGLRGHTIGLAPSAIVYHEDRASVRQHFRRFSHYSEYQVLLFRKYRHLSGRRFAVNPYPMCRLLGALAALPRAVMNLLHRDASVAWTCWLQIVEAGGVWWGDIVGSIRFGELYV